MGAGVRQADRPGQGGAAQGVPHLRARRGPGRRGWPRLRATPGGDPRSRPAGGEGHHRLTTITATGTTLARPRAGWRDNAFRRLAQGAGLAVLLLLVAIGLFLGARAVP